MTSGAASSRRDHIRSKAMAMVAVAVLATSGLVMPRTVAAAGGELFWDGDSSTFATFGPNEAVTIGLGFIKYACDTFFPTADIYIVDTLPVNGDALVDVGGVENTVFGASGGLFSDTIGFTQPAGQLATGTYSVVYDECQDGKFDSNVDTVFPNAFAVVVPADVPPLSPFIQGIKLAAGDQAVEWQKTIAGYDILLNLEKLEIVLKCLTFDVTACVDAFATDVIVGGLGNSFSGANGLSPTERLKVEARDAANDMFKHWDAIAGDPPDPAYQQITRLESIAPLTPAGSALDQAMIAFGAESGIQAALAEALLHSMERYQGADLAGDGIWALEHAGAIQRYALLLSGQVVRTNGALVGLRTALAADARDFDAVAAFAATERTRILASGLNDSELASLASLGITDQEIGAAVAAIDAFEPGAFREATFDDALNSQMAGGQAAAADLMTLAASMTGVIAGLEADPEVPSVRPSADAGGPYLGSLGVPLALDGSGSSDPGGSIASYAWDLDGDAQFNDAVGVSPSTPPSVRGDGLIGLLVVDGDGNAAVDYALLGVADPNHAPSIDTFDPGDSVPSLAVGSFAEFEVSASDVDSDPLSIDWELDGDPVGAGPNFQITPTSGDRGVHLLEAVVSDGLSGAVARHSWNLLVRMPDADGDGWPVDVDCDDTDAQVNPDMFEIRGNGTDDDCFAASTDVITDIPTGGSGGDNSVVVPYLSAGWSYIVVGNGSNAGFEAPAFDDSAWSPGTAAFASDTTGCGMTLGQTHWPAYTDVLIRRHINLPAGTTGARFRIVVDNDVQAFLNGTDVSGGLVVHGGCPSYGAPFVFNIADDVLVAGDNVIAVRGHDYGGFSYLDVELVADIPANDVPSGTTGVDATVTAAAHLVRDFAWTIEKTASPDTWDLFDGDTGTSGYNVTLDRSEGPGNGTVDGRVCVTNPGGVATEGLAIQAAVHEGRPPSPASVASVTVNVSGNPVLDPGESACYPYSVELPSGAAHWATQYTTVARVSITNHALASGAFGPQALASDSMTEDSPSPLSTVVVNDPDDTDGPATYTGDGERNYTRTYGCADEGVRGADAVIAQTGQTGTALVTVACHELAVTSTIAALVDRTHSWTIDKTANTSDLTLAVNQAFAVEYRVTVDETADENGRAAGSVSVHNSAPIAAVVTDVDELLAGVGAASVDCGAALPIVIPTGGTLSCAFEAVVPSPVGTQGTATVARQRFAFGVFGEPQPAGTSEASVSVPVSFTQGGTVVVDACVDVVDTLQGSLGTVCESAAPTTIVYLRNVGPYLTAGTRSVVNTAAFTGQTTRTTGNGSYTVQVNVPGGGCTLTIGYWKTHAGSGPQRDMVSPLLPAWLGTANGAKSVLVSTAIQAVGLLGKDGDASNGINRLDAQLLAAKLNIRAGADPAVVAVTMTNADQFLAGHDASSWRGLSRADKQRVTDWATRLDRYNRGLIGPGHCSE